MFMRLSDGRVGEEYAVLRIESRGLSASLCRRLYEIGVRAGAGLVLVNRKRGGASVIKVCCTRFAIGGEIAAAVHVRRLAENERKKR